MTYVVIIISQSQTSVERKIPTNPTNQTNQNQPTWRLDFAFLTIGCVLITGFDHFLCCVCSSEIILWNFNYDIFYYFPIGYVSISITAIIIFYIIRYGLPVAIFSWGWIVIFFVWTIKNYKITAHLLKLIFQPLCSKIFSVANTFHVCSKLHHLFK